MRKIAVVFPGVGYTKDRPLLYYSGKLAVGYGYELKFVDFSGIKWSKEQLRDNDFLLKTLDKCLHITEDTLADTKVMSGDDVLFISKSIGTVVANAYAKKMSINAGQICFSPLEMIGSFVKEEGAVLFCGDDDPMADFSALERIAGEKRLEIHRIIGGNHSLETGDLFTDIDNLKAIIKRVDEIAGNREAGRQ